MFRIYDCWNIALSGFGEYRFDEVWSKYTFIIILKNDNVYFFSIE